MEMWYRPLSFFSSAAPSFPPLFPRLPIVLRSLWFVPSFAAAYQYFPLSVSPRESIGTARRRGRERDRVDHRFCIMLTRRAADGKTHSAGAVEKSFSGRFPPQLSRKGKSEINNNHNGKQRVADRGRVSMARISDYTFSLT